MTNSHFFAGGVLQENESNSIVPKDYQGREQTWLKHQVLEEYFQSWAYKMASMSRFGSPIKLWFVDTFAGPWNARNEDLEDTSISIGLKTLESVANYWKEKNTNVEIGAIFIEKDSESYKALKKFLDSKKLNFQTHALPGAFADNVPEIEQIIKKDPAFCFVDPTGWKGAEMECINKLVKVPYRDVLINFMYDYVNRFVDHSEGTQQEDMEKFFGGKVPPGLNEKQMMQLYQERLKKICGLRYTANLQVVDPLRDRTKFRLVLGCNHPKALILFRDVESRVMSQQPAIVANVREEKKISRTGQLSMLEGEDLVPGKNPFIEGLDARKKIHEVFKKTGVVKFEDFYPTVLEECHITHGQVKEILWSHYKQGNIKLDGVAKCRTVKDQHTVLDITDNFL